MSVTPLASGDGKSGETSGGSVKLTEAVSMYIRLKGERRPVTVRRAAERACGYVMDACGDKDLIDYTIADVNRFRDALLGKGLAESSITRVLGTVRSVFNFACAEIGITVSNPFAGVYYDRQAGVEDRQPLSNDTIRSRQALFRDEDEDLRWPIALVSDTGMRLAVAAGLTLNDIILEGTTPRVVVQEHP